MRRFAVLLMLLAAPAASQTRPPAMPPIVETGADLERVPYPFPVQRMETVFSGTPASMVYMDVRPDRPNGRTAVLLHGKNFCGVTWERTARTLSAAGWRVLIPDQIGFCKSSKPRSAQYSLHQMASLTARLMTERGIARATVIGHSMGGMLAMRMAIAYPGRVDELVLVNPIGLADRSADGIPYTPVDRLLDEQRKTSFERIKAYQVENYYHGTWSPAYERWARMQAGMYAGIGRETVELAQAKTSEMIYTQPVAYELNRIKAPVTLIVGTLDRTVFGRAQAPATLAQFLKTVPQLATASVGKFADARLVRLPGLGHAPQVEAPERFEQALMTTLAQSRGAGRR